MGSKAEPPQTGLFLVYQADAQGKRWLQTLPNVKVQPTGLAGRASQTEIYFDDVVAPASLITGLP